jgi:hypothetical protein
MKLSLLSVLATAFGVVAAAPTLEAGKCTFSCLNTFNKCMYEHQGSIPLCREETVKEIPSASSLRDC